MTIYSPYKAIADDTRREILDALRAESLTAGGIAERFSEISRPAVTKHLTILLRSRLVRVRKRGRERIYSLNAAPLREVNMWLQQYELFWDQQLKSFKDYVESSSSDKAKENDYDNES